MHTAHGGFDELFIGDGTSLQITHIGSTSLNSPYTSFHLNNVLCVPKAYKNLISISKLCDDNSTSIELFPFSF